MNTNINFEEYLLALAILDSAYYGNNMTVGEIIEKLKLENCDASKSFCWLDENNIFPKGGFCKFSLNYIPAYDNMLIREKGSMLINHNFNNECDNIYEECQEYDIPITIDKEIYKRLLKTEEWNNKRIRILKRDSFTCQVCGRKNNLQVHHIHYIKNRYPWQYYDFELVTLCSVCHKNIHGLK